MKLNMNGCRALLAGIALVVCLGFALNAQAQTCTTGNWSNGSGVTGSPTVGVQDGDNRRYGGPCGMRANLDTGAHYVTDDTPSGEIRYIARFYVFLENPGTGPITLFAADDGTDDRFRVLYEGGAILLSVCGSGCTPANDNEWVDIPSGGVAVGSSWHSVELEWVQDASAVIALNVNGAGDVTDTVDTSGITIENVHLGNLNAAGGGGLLDFDDFDSRRSERPGRLMTGDANGDETLNFFDLFELNNELSPGDFYAAGQPDCNEDGTINFFDLFCINNLL